MLCFKSISPRAIGARLPGSLAITSIACRILSQPVAERQVIPPKQRQKKRRKFATSSGFRLPGRIAPADRRRLHTAILRPLDELAFEDLAARGQRKRRHRDEV